MVGNNVDIANLSIADLGLFAAPEASIELLTMHKAKGREFSAVAIIKLHEGLVPRRGSSVQQVDEFRRLFYVGITRAEKLLMYVTDREDTQHAVAVSGPRWIGVAGGAGVGPCWLGGWTRAAGTRRLAYPGWCSVEHQT
jgi:DNA helicase II / ATP-dependent DNA helicase PcrA